MGAKRRAMVAGATLTASALFAASAQAQTTYTVTTLNDSSDVGCTATCSLRDAINAADADGQADTIVFQSGLSGTITLGSDLPTISDSGLTIDGPGAGTMSVSGAGNYQPFDITDDGSTTISGLTITDGSSGGDGGAIDNEDGGNLTLTDDVISDSTAEQGAGIASDGFSTISGTTVSGNTATGDDPGGGIYLTYPCEGCFGADEIENSTITGNTAEEGVGGGVSSNTVYLAISGSTISNNQSSGFGGGISAEDTKYGLNISGSTISGNTSATGGGGIAIYNSSFEIRESGAPPKYQPVTIATSTISNNKGQLGAGIDLDGALPGSPMTISASTISGNQGGSDSYGGGLLVQKYAYAPIETIDSTISGNSATYGGGASLGYNGSYSLFGDSAHGSVSFDNSTIAGNTAYTTGGGIYLSQYPGSSGQVGPTAAFRSTIVSGNTAAGSPQDLDQAVASSGGFNGAFDLVQNQGNAQFLSQNAMIFGKDPLLGSLQNNGGPTETMLPAGTSPVIDQGHAAKGLTADQRGDPRTVPVNGITEPPGGDGTDIGAVELPASAVVVPSPPSAGPAGFTASVRGQLIGGGSVTPVIVRGITLVNCSVKTGTLTGCSIQVRAKDGRLLARGAATSSTPVKSLSMHVTATDWGRFELFKHQLGITDGATATGETSAAGPQKVTGNVKVVGRSINLHISRTSAKLSRHMRGELRQATKLLIDSGAKSATCTAYAAISAGDPTLTRAQAKAACKALKKDGFTHKTRSVGAGYTRRPRRLTISFKF